MMFDPSQYLSSMIILDMLEEWGEDVSSQRKNLEDLYEAAENEHCRIANNF